MIFLSCLLGFAGWALAVAGGSIMEEATLTKKMQDRRAGALGAAISLIFIVIAIAIAYYIERSGT